MPPAPDPAPILREGVVILPPDPDPAPAGAGASADRLARMARLETLAGFYLDGARRALLITGATAPGWYAALDDFARLLSSRGRPRLVWREVDGASDTARAMRRLLDEASAARPRRKVFERLAGDPGEERGAALAELQARDAGEVFALAPVIDPGRCSGCDACLRVCPPGVLVLTGDKEGRESYTCSPAACDGCGLCLDVCADEAISLVAMSARPGDIHLRSWTCAGCGVGVHAPAQQEHEGGLCTICARTGHHKSLFQVLP